MPDRLGDAGARPPREPVYAPIFVAASLTGLYTQRNVFHDPSNIVSQRFYGGRPDALFNGLNIELSNELTLIRRFGNIAVSANYTQPPLNAFQWELDTGQIVLNIDTQAFVYNEPLTGSAAAPIFTKSALASRGYFVASGNTLYYGDGIDLIKYTPGNPNGLIWNWGIAAPLAKPNITTVATGSTAVQWNANTVFSTMGLLVDPNSNVQQLTGVNSNPAVPNSTQIGTSGNGAPNFSTGYGTTTTDGSVTWTSQGQITLWAPNTLYQPGNAIFDPATNCIFIASHSYAVTSSSNRPNFSSTLGLSGARVTESSGARWENIGQVGVAPGAVTQWAKNTAFAQYHQPSGGSDPTNANSAIVFPLVPAVSASGQLNNGQPTYLLGATVAGTTANTTYTPWTGIPSQTLGQVTIDDQLAWICLGPAAWVADQSLTQWIYGNATFSVIKDTNGNMQVCIGQGTTGALEPGSTATLTAASNASGGNTTYTGTFPTPFPVGFPATITGFTNAGNNATGQVISCNATTLVIVNPNGVAETHAGTATFDAWATIYGGQTPDGTATWVCVGPPVSWSANTLWFLPVPGFAPPLATQAYGGAEVIGSSFAQAVTTSGLSGGSAPSWSTTVGGTTTDNTITWTTVGAFTARSITWTKSHVYAFSFKCRTPTDAYVTTSLLTLGNLNTVQMLTPLGNVPGLVTPLGAYAGGGTGAVSTASPVTTLSTPNITGAQNQISGFGSPDPQVDTIIIWRDADGGGASNMFELIEIPAPKPIGGMSQPWQFNDFLPDIASTVGGINYPGLDNLSPAPIDHQNDPPPTGFLPLCDELHFSRIWGAVSNTVFPSAGPDTLVGNGNEAFNPGNDDFPFKSTVVACIHSPAGLICPTTTDIECIYGGPSTTSFYSQNMIKKIGLLNYNAWDRVGGEIYFVSTDCQLWSFNPTVQLARAGFPIGNLLASQLPVNGSNVSVVAYENGTDNAVFVGDGASGWYRLNPHQVGADMSGENAICWSPFAQINGGAQLLKSVLKPTSAPSPPSGISFRSVQGTSNASATTFAIPVGSVNAGDFICLHLLSFVPNTSGSFFADGGSGDLAFSVPANIVTSGIGSAGAGKCDMHFCFQMTQPGNLTVTANFLNDLTLAPIAFDLLWYQVVVVSGAVLKGIPTYPLPVGGGTPQPSVPNGTTSFALNDGDLAVSLAGAYASTIAAGWGGNETIPSLSVVDSFFTQQGSTGLIANGILSFATISPTSTVNANSQWNNNTLTTFISSGQWSESLAVYLFSPAPPPPVAASQRQLIIGSNQANKPILARSTSTFLDAGTPYHAWFEIGAITMVYPGQRAAVKFLEFDFMPLANGSALNPLVYYALDDPSPTPTWVSLANFVYDPPIAYGGTAITPPYLPERFYLNQNADTVIGRRIRLKVDFGSNVNNGRDELISFAIFGKKYVEQ